MMSDNQQEQNQSPFEAIRQIAEDGSEYWSARNLAKVLGYTRFDKFQNAIQKAEIACANSGQRVEDHMSHVRRMIDVGKGAKREVEDVLLSRYGAYITVQNSDPEKEIVALGQTYFATQTRRQELTDQWEALPEAQKRLTLRGEINVHNTNLAAAARQSGVVQPKDFAIFQYHGYMGLYGGLKAADIQTRKGLGNNQHILDYMGSDELAANIFRASQTKQKLERDKIKGKENANRTHFEVGKKVRETIEELGGTMPEDQPVPAESIQQLEQKEKKRQKQGPQLSMFDEPDQKEKDK